MNQGLNLHFEFEGLLAKARRSQLLGTQFHGVSQQRSETGDKLRHLAHGWKLLAQILDLAQQVRVAILNRTGHLIVSIVTIHDQDPRQPLGPEDLLATLAERLWRKRKRLTRSVQKSQA